MIVVIVHIIALLAYQNEWPQEIVPVSSAWARYLALTAVYHTNCSHPRYVEYTGDADLWIYGYALRLFWLYYVLALQTQFLNKKPVSLYIYQLNQYLDIMENKTISSLRCLVLGLGLGLGIG